MSVILSLLLAAAPQSAFGLHFGDPLPLPECQHAGVGYGADQPVTCQRIYTPSARNHWAGTFVQFAKDAVPQIMSSSILGAWIESHALIGVQFETLGVSDQDEVLRVLTAKYGKPSSIARPTIQNLSGATFLGISAQWISPDIFVAFDSTFYKISSGKVEILTPHAKAISDDERAASDAKKATL